MTSPSRLYCAPFAISSCDTIPLSSIASILAAQASPRASFSKVGETSLSSSLACLIMYYERQFFSRLVTIVGYWIGALIGMKYRVGVGSAQQAYRLAEPFFVYGCKVDGRL
jgi:hypothetical protein